MLESCFDNILFSRDRNSYIAQNFIRYAIHKRCMSLINLDSSDLRQIEFNYFMFLMVSPTTLKQNRNRKPIKASCGVTHKI